MKCEEKPVLQVQHLTVRYGEGCPHCQTHLEKNRCTVCGTVWAANDVSVEVYPGEVLGIVGESGSGKSTLMQSLYFDIAPTSGEAYLQDYKGGKESIWNASAGQYAFEYDLFLTGGSDFHGRYEGVSVDIGDYLAEPSGIRAILRGEEA